MSLIRWRSNLVERQLSLAVRESNVKTKYFIASYGAVIFPWLCRRPTGTDRRRALGWAPGFGCDP